MATFSKHTATAIIPGLPYTVPAHAGPDVIVPGHYIVVAGGTVYSQDFESYEYEVNPDGWVATGADVLAVDFGGAHSGTNAMFVNSSTEVSPPARRSITGLVVGRKYVLSAWARPFEEDIVGTVGITGIGETQTPLSPDGWTEVTYAFTATATSHELVLGSLTSVTTWDDITLSEGELVWVPTEVFVGATIPELSLGYTPLSVISWNLTLDEAYNPYVMANLTVTADPYAVGNIDPRLGQRVTLSLTQTWGDSDGDWNTFGYRAPVTRTFSLMLRSRQINPVTGELELSLSSDEGYLFDRALVALSPERTYGLSVKTAVAYALAKVGFTLASDSEDADLVTKALDPVRTNLALNPAGRVNTTYWGGTNSTISRLTGLTIPGLPGVTTAIRGTQISATTGGLYNNSDAATPYITVVPGTSYEVSMWVRSSVDKSVQQGVQWNGTTVVWGNTFNLLANVWTRISSVFTPAAGQTRLGPFTYSTVAWAAGNTFDATALLVEPGNTLNDFFDGATVTDNGLWTHAWTGTAHASPSTKTNLPNNEATIWEPGQTAWDYLEPITQQGGLRLWCDENRVWHLNKTWAVEGVVTVSPETGVKAATDTISRDGGWYDSVVIKYLWTDDEGESQTRYDIAGAPGTVTLTLPYDRPYPGPGAAAHVLSRATGKGRTYDIENMSDYRATPGMAIVATVPNAPIQSGVVSAVTWTSEGTMQVASRGLTDTPVNAWALALGNWNAATGTWTAATGTN